MGNFSAGKRNQRFYRCSCFKKSEKGDFYHYIGLSTDPVELLKESVRVSKPSGTILYSSYAEQFWKHRLEWFQLQADHKLIGEIDHNLTKNGTIVCRDGLRAVTWTARDFLALTSKFNMVPEIIEVDGSSVFCKMKVPEHA